MDASYMVKIDGLLSRIEREYIQNEAFYTLNEVFKIVSSLTKIKVNQITVEECVLKVWSWYFRVLWAAVEDGNKSRKNITDVVANMAEHFNSLFDRTPAITRELKESIKREVTSKGVATVGLDPNFTATLLKTNVLCILSLYSSPYEMSIMEEIADYYERYYQKHRVSIKMLKVSLAY